MTKINENKNLIKLTETEIETIAKEWYDFFLDNHKTPEIVGAFRHKKHLYVKDIETAVSKRVHYITMSKHGTKSGGVEVFYLKPPYEHKNKITRTENT